MLAVDEIIAVPALYPCSFAFGRFQPVHNGHVKVLKKLSEKKLPIFLFVVNRGIINENNPLELDFKLKLIKKSIEEIENFKIREIITVPDGFLGTFVNELRQRNFEPKYVAVGSDRAKEYRARIERYKHTWKLNIDLQEIKRNKHGLSSSKIRTNIFENSYLMFKKKTTNLNYTDFAQIRKRLEKFYPIGKN